MQTESAAPFNSVGISSLIAEAILVCGIIAVGYYLHFEFIASSLVAIFVGRKVGWFLCRNLFYHIPTTILISLMILYGSAVALGVALMINAFLPGMIIKWVFGYGAGAYIAEANYGLLAQNSVRYMPSDLKARHVIIETVPGLTYIAASLILAWA